MKETAQQPGIKAQIFLRQCVTLSYVRETGLWQFLSRQAFSKLKVHAHKINQNGFKDLNVRSEL